MKTKLQILTTALSMALMVSPLYAQSPTTVNFNNNKTSVATVLEKDTTYLAVRDFATATQLDVNYDVATRTVKLVDGDTLVTVNAKTGETKLNGEVKGKTTVLNKDDKVYLPLRALCELMGMEVAYEKGNITVSKPVAQQPTEQTQQPQDEVVDLIPLQPVQQDESNTPTEHQETKPTEQSKEEVKPVLDLTERKVKLAETVISTQIAAVAVIQKSTTGLNADEEKLAQQLIEMSEVIVAESVQSLKGTEDEDLVVLASEVYNMLIEQLKLDNNSTEKMTLDQLKAVSEKVDKLTEKAVQSGVDLEIMLKAYESFTQFM